MENRQIIQDIKIDQKTANGIASSFISFTPRNDEVVPAAGNEDHHFKNLFQKKNNSNVNNTARFMEKLETTLAPNLPAKELISLIVRSALEIEYGRSFTLSPAFDKIVGKISNSVMVNPVLRRQALSVVSMFVESKIELGKKN